MPITAPIRDTKDTAKFSQLVNSSPEPVLVTKNGYEDYIALSVEQYNDLRYRASMSELYAGLLKSERQAAEGDSVSYGELRRVVDERYGL